MRPGQIKNRTQLLVEGKDALNFFAAFAKHLTLTGIQIQDFGGVNDLGDFLEAFSTAPGFHKVDSVGIVRDAEKLDETSVTGTRDAERGAPLRREATRAGESAFQSVCTALRNAGLPVPRSAIEKTVSRPVVSILIGQVAQSGAPVAPNQPCAASWLTCRASNSATRKLTSSRWLTTLRPGVD